jgi:hypothetical protein
LLWHGSTASPQINSCAPYIPENADTQNLDQLSNPNLTEQPAEGLPKVPAKRLLPAMSLPDLSPDETTLLPTENAPSRTPYLRGIIGKLDPTLDPMIPTGSIVQIDIGKPEISPTKDWTHEFERPIYFLKTKDGYVCGWCELDEDSQSLILILHRYRLPPAGDGSMGQKSKTWKSYECCDSVGRMNLTG